MTIERHFACFQHERCPEQNKKLRFFTFQNVFLSFFSESADHLLAGDGKFEEIIACSQEIAAATAQLVAASNVKNSFSIENFDSNSFVFSQVKADRESKNREALSQASKSVNASTAQVVATAKSCSAIIDEKSNENKLDFL